MLFSVTHSVRLLPALIFSLPFWPVTLLRGVRAYFHMSGRQYRSTDRWCWDNDIDPDINWALLVRMTRVA